jgi:hypothetical protein
MGTRVINSAGEWQPVEDSGDEEDVAQKKIGKEADVDADYEMWILFLSPTIMPMAINKKSGMKKISI